jgi:beta-lactamase superfamily II metal-dependent hydrolase
MGGLPGVLYAFEVRTVYLSGDTKGTSTFNAFLRGVQEEGSQVVEARAGMQMDWGDTTVDVISPPPDRLFEEANDNCVSTLLTFGSSHILLTGDAEKKAEEYMSSGPYTGPVAVLKVGIHGSNSSSTPRFLNSFKPDIAVIQVGAGKSYALPRHRRLNTSKRQPQKCSVTMRTATWS